MARRKYRRGYRRNAAESRNSADKFLNIGWIALFVGFGIHVVNKAMNKAAK